MPLILHHLNTTTLQLVDARYDAKLSSLSPLLNFRRDEDSLYLYRHHTPLVSIPLSDHLTNYFSLLDLIDIAVEANI